MITLLYIIVHGRTSSSSTAAIAVTASGEVITTSSYVSSPVQLYSSATHVDADSSTSTMTVGANSRQVNIMGRSSQLCTLKVMTSPDNTTYYDTIYNLIVRETDSDFYMSVPTFQQYLKMSPDADTSLTIKYTY